MTDAGASQLSVTVDGWNRDGFAKRLKAAIGSDSPYAFAKKCGFAESLMRKYLADEATPGADKLAVMAEKSGVQLDWLIRGKGPMHENQVQDVRADYETSALDLELLQDVLEGVESSLEEAKRYLPPDKRAELVLNIYEIFRESGAKPDRERILRLVKSVA